MAKSRKGPIRQKPPALPRRPGQYAISDVPAEQQRLIGLVVLNWAKLEHDIEEAIWAFLSLDIDQGRAVTSRLSADTKIELLKSLVMAYFTQDIRLNDILDCLDVITIQKEDRNFIVHGSWVMLMPGNIPACTSLRPKAPPGQIMVETFPEDRMINLINGILNSKTHIMHLIAMLEASREKRQLLYLPLPASPPQDQ